MRNSATQSEPRFRLEDLSRMVPRTTNPIKKFGTGPITKVTSIHLAEDRRGRAMWSCRSIFIFCLPNPVGGIHPQMRGTGHPPCCNVSGNPKAGPSARHATKAPPISHPRRTGRQESVSPGKMHRAPRLWGQDLEEKIEGVNKMKPEKQSQWPSFKNMRTTGYPPLVSAKIKNLSHAATGMLDEDRLRQVDHLFAGVERIGFSFP